MDKDFGSYILTNMFGTDNFNDDKRRELLKEAMMNNNANIRELARLVGVDENSVKNAISRLKEMIEERAKKEGVSVGAMYDLITKG